jgi:hypothetical protein
VKELVIKKKRQKTKLVLELIILGFAGVVMGGMSGTSLDFTGKSMFDNAMLVVLFYGVLSIIMALPTFGDDRLIFWRESAVGINTTSFFYAKVLVDLPFILLRTLAYFCVYYCFTGFLGGLAPLIWMGLCMNFCCTNWGYMLSLLVPRANNVLISVIIAILMGAFLAGTEPLLAKCPHAIKQDPSLFHDCHQVPAIEAFTSISYSRWGMEFYICTMLNYLPAYHQQDFSSFITKYSGFCHVPGPEAGVAGLHRIYWLPLLILIIQGFILQIFSQCLLNFTCRDQQLKPRLFGK